MDVNMLKIPSLVEVIKKNAPPNKADGDGLCGVHNVTLVHKPFKASMMLLRKADQTVVKHCGDHDHPQPHEKLSKRGKASLEAMIAINSKAPPRVILAGGDFRKSARDIQPVTEQSGQAGISHEHVQT